MAIDPQTTVGSVAVEHPLATRVFARHGIDFCCGGGRPLEEVCREKDVSIAELVAEIDAEISPSTDVARRWDDAAIGDLIEHILRTYHDAHKEELPRLEAMARKVHQVHGAKDPERLRGIMDTVTALRADLDEHLLKEERILFPMILAGQGASASDPIAVMEEEHEAVGAMLRRLRELTNGYEIPEGACNTWRALWVGLEELERDLHEHIHLENNVLHPRTLGA